MTATAADRLRRFRARKREGKLLLPRIEISASLADELVEAGLLPGWDVEDPEAVAAAVVKLLNLLPHIRSIAVSETAFQHDPDDAV